MTILTVLNFPDDRLRTKAAQVTQINDETRLIIDNMLETMYAENGVGLAATQVNIHQRNIKMKSIEEALEKGHCSAVILCNATLENSQVDQLKYYAKKGQTRCIILNKQTLNTSINLVQKNMNIQNLSLELH